MAAAAHQADEFRPPRHDGQKRRHDVGRVVIRVHGVQVGAELVLQFVKRGDRGRPALILEPFEAGLDEDRAEPELGRPIHDRACNRCRTKNIKGGHRRVWLEIGLDRAQVVPVGPHLWRPTIRDSLRIGQRRRVELAAAKRAGQGRGARHQELGAGPRGRLAVNPDDSGQHHLLATRQAFGEGFLDARHWQRPQLGRRR